MCVILEEFLCFIFRAAGAVVLGLADTFWMEVPSPSLAVRRKEAQSCQPEQQTLILNRLRTEMGLIKTAGGSPAPWQCGLSRTNPWNRVHPENGWALCVPLSRLSDDLTHHAHKHTCHTYTCTLTCHIYPESWVTNPYTHSGKYQ